MVWLWAALTALGAVGFLFPYAVYPLLVRPRRRDEPPAPEPTAWPRVSAIVAAYNAAGRIAAKTAELKALDYPGPLEVIVADDASDDRTAELAAAAGADRVVRLPARGGKSLAQNAALREATGDVLLFTDVAVNVAPDALRRLIPELLRPGVGCVTGVDRSIAAGADDPAQGAGLYTRFETALRGREAGGSLLGVNGCLFVVRRIHRPPVPPDCVDDLYVPLAVNNLGLRVTLCPAAAAAVPRARSLGDEFRRRVRTFAGGMFTLQRARRDLPRAAADFRWRIIGRKWMRWLGPAFLAAALVGSLGLALRWPPGWLLFLAQAAGWLAAAVGIAQTAAGRPPRKPLRLAAFAALSQAALVWAWARFATGRSFVVWRPTPREG